MASFRKGEVAHSGWCLHCCTSKGFMLTPPINPPRDAQAKTVLGLEKDCGCEGGRVALLLRKPPLRGRCSASTDPQCGLDLGWRILFFSLQKDPQTNPFLLSTQPPKTMPVDDSFLNTTERLHSSRTLQTALLTSHLLCLGSGWEARKLPQGQG